ncbi:MAG: rod shape-determining protein MreD [Peptococcaceae bacterium BICA1-7]|nr:MAG: rod shape-determining protein MreD [Peptococcaceae bacterium BICA1-7]HBV98758.1 rod shape-determining protein MreD [Desulfotomaculum sp.]
MRLLFLMLLMGLAIFLQVTLLNFFPLFGVKPDLILMLVVFNSFLKGSREGALVGLLGGVFIDLANGSYIGMNSLALMIVGYLVGFTESKIYKDSSIIIIFLVWVASLLDQLLTYILLYSMQVQISPGVALFRVMLPTATYTAVLVPFFYHRFYSSSQAGLLRGKNI